MNTFLNRFKAKLRNTRHHLRSADWKTLRQYEHLRTGRKHLPLLTLLHHSWRYGADFADNYMLDFFGKSPAEIRRYITRSVFFEFCEQVNHADYIPITRDKQRFAAFFKDFLGRKVWSWEELKQQPDTSPAPARLVVKQRWGCKGQGIYFLEPHLPQWSELRALLKAQFISPTDYVYEEYLEQHPELARLNPGTVNTLRVYTFIERDLEVAIWGMFLRVGVHTGIDSFHQGGVAIALNEEGQTCTPLFSKNPFVQVDSLHPLSRQPLIGFQVPHIEAVKNLVYESARMLPQVRVVGWDVAITSEGPCLIEGNDRGSHLMFQKLRNEGYRDLLTPHFKDVLY